MSSAGLHSQYTVLLSTLWMFPPLSSEMTSFIFMSTDGEQLVDVVAAVSTEVQAESIAVLIVAVLCIAQCCTLPTIIISM